MAEQLETPALPCPECRAQGWGGQARVGNRRNRCTTCNNFAQNVRRIAMQRLRDKHPEEYRKTRLQVERDLYPQVIQDWSDRL